MTASVLATLLECKIYQYDPHSIVVLIVPERYLHATLLERPHARESIYDHWYVTDEMFTLKSYNIYKMNFPARYWNWFKSVIIIFLSSIIVFLGNPAGQTLNWRPTWNVGLIICLSFIIVLQRKPAGQILNRQISEIGIDNSRYLVEFEVRYRGI